MAFTENDWRILLRDAKHVFEYRAIVEDSRLDALEEQFLALPLVTDLLNSTGQ